nr:MAG TPA: hypothetical protein [Bacteriophage sp.]
MDSNHQDLVYDQAVPSYLHFLNNPELRVSKVFIVLCLPLGNFIPCLPHGDIHVDWKYNNPCRIGFLRSLKLLSSSTH